MSRAPPVSLPKVISMTQTPHIRRNPILREIAALLPGLEAITQGGPRPADLETAPRLDHWCHVARGPVPALAGIVAGHPVLRATAMVTSQLLWCDPIVGWARTRSRWYRLGRGTTVAPEVLYGGRRMPPLPAAQARALTIRAPRVLLAAARDLRAQDLAERLKAVTAAWPPDAGSRRLH